MKTVILSLSAPFTHGMLYKENCFVHAAIEAGDEVTVITTTYEYKDGRETKTDAGIFDMPGYTLIRLERVKLGHRMITDKLRVYRDLENTVIGLAPDAIFYNGPQIWNVQRLGRIRRALPSCRIVWGFSVWSGNSGRNALSLNVLHKMIYRSWLRGSVKYVDRIFFTGQETKDFLLEIYKLPKDKMELNDLPGVVISEEEKRAASESFRKEKQLPEDAIVFSHSGKMDKLKKTVELLDAFRACRDERFRLYVIGSFTDDVRDASLEKINGDDRITYVGFVTGNELEYYLRASDVYLQPGSVSQTFQNAICSGCAVMGSDCDNNRKLFRKNGWLIKDDGDMIFVLETISKDPRILDGMSASSLEIAKEKLDYRTLYAKIYT